MDKLADFLEIAGALIAIAFFIYPPTRRCLQKALRRFFSTTLGRIIILVIVLILVIILILVLAMLLTRISIDIAGKWEGLVMQSDGSVQVSVQLSIQEFCTPGQICGTYFSGGACEGDLEFVKLEGNTYQFVERLRNGPPLCATNGIQSLTLLSANELSLVYHHDISGLSASGVLLKK